MEISKVAVIGSGVMGSGIAAQVANAGFPVVLLDIVPKEAQQRNQLADDAVSRQLKIGGFMSQSAAQLVSTGNLEDDLGKLADCDWIIEAVIENLDIKHDLYQRVDAVRKAGSIVSSNTSTIPLDLLIAHQSPALQQDFIITHFFNPPRYMRLLELVTGDKTRAEVLPLVRDFSDVHLGKGIVNCKDTPGFIANRIGIYWMQKALLSAFEHDVSVEEADALMSRPIGIPKTGVFGLWDLVGIDLGPHLIDSLVSTLNDKDAFQQLAQTPERINNMIETGYTGRKGKGGFYCMKKVDGAKVMEALDLSSGDYRPLIKPTLDSLKSSDLRALLSHDDKGGAYAWDVLSSFLQYSASLVPEICDDLYGVDEAMRLGYNWQYGPFELIDLIGAEWFAQRLQDEGREVPALISAVGSGSFYRINNGKRQQFGVEGQYNDIQRAEGVLLLADLKLANKPVAANDSASLWDLGDGIACLEFHTKMNAVDRGIFEMIHQSLNIVREEFNALVLYNEGRAFSAGANLQQVKQMVEQQQWEEIADFVQLGQQTYQTMQQATFPVVGAPAGLALGGGCEVLLHCHALQAYAETNAGLVEKNVGLIPGWGGCKEMLKRWNARQDSDQATQTAFKQIASARISGSAEEAREMGILNEQDNISMNRDRLLSDAKNLSIKLAQNFQAFKPVSIPNSGPSGKQQLLAMLQEWANTGKATEYDQVIATELAGILSDDEATQISEETLLDREREVFNRLLKNQGTLDRIDHMLTTGKPLRN